MPKGIANKRYTPEFKKLVIKTMLEEKLSYSETARWFDVGDHARQSFFNHTGWNRSDSPLRPGLAILE